MYAIKAASFILPIPFFRRLVHQYWMLEDLDQKKIVAELHGLATSRQKGKIVLIGYRKDHGLRAHHIVISSDFAKKYGFDLSSFRLPRHLEQTVYEGEDALERWQRAVAVIDMINELDLDYPRFCSFDRSFS